MKSHSHTLIAAILALVLTLAVGTLISLPFGRGLEAWMGDKMLTWRYDLLKGTAKPDPHLLLVAIDQPSVSDLGRWPFPRGIHGLFLHFLAPENPSVVAWDIFFTEKTAPSSTSSSVALQLQPDDQTLVDGAKLIPRMVTAATGDSTSGSTLRDEDATPTRPLKNIIGNPARLISFPFAVVPFPELRQVSTFGFAEAGAKELRRTLPLVVNIDGKIFPSFDLQILLHYWGVDPDHVVVDIGHEITLPRPDGTEARIPINDKGELLVNYRARAEDFRTMGYSVMGKGLADKHNKRASEEQSRLPGIKDAIVVVGVTLTGTDNGPIPIDPYSPLVVAQLNGLNTILQHDYLHLLSPAIGLPLYGLFLFVLGNAMLRVGVSPMIPLGIAALVLVAGTAFAALCLANEVVPVMIPELGVLVLAGAVPARLFFGEEREKTRIKNVLRANLSEKVMNKMLEHPDNVKLGGAKQEITVMFCDIRNFTRYCDDRDPREVMDVLNAYMEEMTQVVFRHDGTVDKYIGDCLMAFWNAPEPQADHADRAVRCAIDMRSALATFKLAGTKPGAGLDLLECGIGIHTGDALVGNMGSSLKRSYTAMGSTVNLAARLEALTKQLNERILISQDVVARLRGDFPLTDRGEVSIAGFAKPVHVYAVASDSQTLPPS